jgi:hypothetical protein
VLPVLTMSKLRKIWRSGGCHCGTVRFEVHVPEDVEIIACNCSICTKSGFLHLIVSDNDFRLIQGESALTKYTFNTGVAKHYFCSKCGIKPFYVPRSHPDGWSVNFHCLDDRHDFKSVIITEFDGSNWESNAAKLASLENN